MSDPRIARLSEVVRYFLRLGAVGFGGPIALVGTMERELVAGRGWLDAARMREAVAICQTLPGPLAIQVGIYIAYLRAGFWGAIAGGWAFILPNFLIVAALGALYIRVGEFQWMTAVFYGVGPAVIAMILHSTWRLAKLGMEDAMQWMIAAAAFAATVALETEIAVVFIAAGITAMIYYGARRRLSATTFALAGPLELLWFFLKAGSLTFGSGLVIVPFLENGLVQQSGWLNERQFLVAVAIGMISPGPVVITATFVGYLVAGFWGALAGTVGIFTPSFIFVLGVAPVLARHRANRELQSFVKGAYAAAIGTILGATLLLGRVAIGDWLTASLGALSLVALSRWKLSNPSVMAVAAAAGLLSYGWLEPAWVLVK